jgi:nucleoside-triphosphatase THEP1
VRAPAIGLVVGEIGAGKTTLCLRVAGQARAQGWRVGGIVTRPLLAPSGSRTALLAEDLWTGEEQLLASLERDLGGPGCGRHSFAAEAFAWACRAVEAALTGGADLIILDEVGPLELAAGAGFAPVLSALLQAPCARLLVVRRGWWKALAERLPSAPLIFEVEPNTRDGLAERVVGALLPQLAPGHVPRESAAPIRER